MGGGLLCANLANGGLLFERARAAEIFLPEISPAEIEKVKENVSVVTLPGAKSEAINNPNALPLGTPDGFLAKPLIVETKTAASAKKLSVVKPTTTTSGVSLLKKTTIKGGTYYEKVANGFPYGYCTYYVASQRPIPWRGNAGTWLSGARAAGFATGSVPKVGAIVVTSESAWGHVGMVTGVSESEVTITEMNYIGFGVVSTRTVPISYGAIKGYIY